MENILSALIYTEKMCTSFNPRPDIPEKQFQIVTSFTVYPRAFQYMCIYWQTNQKKNKFALKFFLQWVPAEPNPVALPFLSKLKSTVFTYKYLNCLNNNLRYHMYKDER